MDVLAGCDSPRAGACNEGVTWYDKASGLYLGTAGDRGDEFKFERVEGQTHQWYISIKKDGEWLYWSVQDGSSWLILSDKMTAWRINRYSSRGSIKYLFGNWLLVQDYWSNVHYIQHVETGEYLSMDTRGWLWVSEYSLPWKFSPTLY